MGWRAQNTREDVVSYDCFARDKAVVISRHERN